MNWDNLLSPRRIREIQGGKPSRVDDHRTPFQSDFDRLVFTPPIRRLQDKTQVFPLDPNDAVRTRLTHSLEVSCVARGMGQRVAGNLLKRGAIKSHEQARAIEDVCGTAGLVHDLGNPAFGHYGEYAISEWFRSGPGAKAVQPLIAEPSLSLDFIKYEGNARTIRLLCHLQVLSDQHGVNLTSATLAAAMKYTAPSHKADKDAPDHAHAKPGYLYSESAVVEAVRKEVGIETARHPLAYLVEAADDCVYSVCDIEDGVKKGILSFNDVIRELKEIVEAGTPACLLIEELDQLARKNVEEGIPTGPKLTGRSVQDAYMQMFRVLAIGRNVSGVCDAFSTNYDDIMAGRYNGELVKDEASNEAFHLIKAFKKLGPTRIYNTRPTIELELRGANILQTILGKLWIGIDPETCDSDAGKRAKSLLSQSYRNIHEFELEESLKNKNYGFARSTIIRYYDLMLLTDYVGGMTDSFACDLYRSITGG